ncbi:MAG: hypothetical protein KA004_04975 [Verrucomicrobiales bacterium]|nr:hypothetical protein [Verrucomicrobiales bacterium]
MLSQLGKQRKEIESRGIRIVLLHLDREPECFRRTLQRHGLEGVGGVEDADGRHHAALGLQRGRWRQLLGWQVIVRGTRAFLRGHRQGKIRADVRQLAGAFLLNHGEIVNRFESRHSGDIPDFLGFIRSNAIADKA